MRIILHIDMNSYFASVEQQANPHLRGRPVGVCEHLGGIIIAPSVEAKRLGIKLGTTVWDALKICPYIVLLPTDPDKYRHTTRGFMKILHDYSDDVEQYSIDEAFVDITKYCRGDFEEALLLGLEIKQRLAAEVGEWVSASIGIAPNKLVAKIAADLDGGVIASGTPRGNPNEIASSGTPRNDSSFLDRICVIRPEEISILYSKLKLTDVPGIGPRLERALHKLGIFSLQSLANYPLENLLNQFGVWGYTLHSLANFNTMTSPFSPPHEEGVGEVADPPKSVGHAYTMPKATSNKNDIYKLMFKLSEKIGRRMRKMNARGSIVHYFHSGPSVIARNEAISFSKQRTIKGFINTGKDIFRVAKNIFFSDLYPSPSPGLGRVAEGRERSNGSIKIMGISVSGLNFENPPDLLFEQYQKPEWLTHALDKINDKYGEYTIRPGSLVDVSEAWVRDTVGFGRTRQSFL